MVRMPALVALHRTIINAVQVIVSPGRAANPTEAERSGRSHDLLSRGIGTLPLCSTYICCGWWSRFGALVCVDLR